MLDIHGMALFKNSRNLVNWGVTSPTGDEPQKENYPTGILAGVSFTQQDVAFLRTLRLEDVTESWVLNIQIAEAFESLMRASADIGDDWGLADPKVWVNDLTWLLPSYSPVSTVETYVAAHCAPSMTALYATALRSDFWNKCLAHLGVDDRIDAAALCPDPVELFSAEDRPPRDATAWKARQREYYRLLRRPESDPGRQLTLQFDMLTQVTATQVPALKQWLDGYQEWLNWEASF